MRVEDTCCGVGWEVVYHKDIQVSSCSPMSYKYNLVQNIPLIKSKSFILIRAYGLSQFY